MSRGVVESAYRAWVRGEGLEIVEANYVEDLGTLAVRPWARTGGGACFINHEDSDRTNDCRLLEIGAGGSLAPQRHLHEQMIYVLSGRGVARVWQESAGDQQSFEWERGSLFAVPLNAWYELFNSSGVEPVRLVAVTNAPLIMNVFADPEFVYSCGYEFVGRFDGEDGYFEGEGVLDGRYLETNFVADLRTIGLHDHSGRGAGGRNVGFDLAGNTMKAHVSEFPVGTYKMAHRHGPGAHVIVLGGVGYTLMWREGEPRRRYDWREGSMITPPPDTFHQHFNIGPEPARYLALRLERGRNLDPETGRPMSMISTREGGDQIDYADEDPQIRAMYREECDLHGAAYAMDEFFASI